MEENFPWRIIFMATAFSLFVLGVAYYLISPRESTFFNSERIEKIAEFKNTRVEGRKEGQKLWEFFAGEGWASKDREVTYLYKVNRGSFYQNGKPAIADLSAPRAKVYNRTDVIEVFGRREGKTGPSFLRAQVDLGKLSSRPKPVKDWARMTADFVKFVPAEKKSQIRGGARLQKKDSTIRAEEISVDHEKRTADLQGKVRIDRKDIALNADRLEYVGDKGQLAASGEVVINIREGTIVKCGQALLFDDLEKDIFMVGSLEAVQGKKIAVASEGFYSKKLNGLTLKGGAKAVLEKARTIIKEGTAAKLRSPDAKNILRQKTVVKADEIFFSTKTGDARASGNVLVTQRGREARADAGVYDDKSEILTLTENVFMKKGKDWVKCKEVLVSVREETFKAVGAVEAQFNL